MWDEVAMEPHELITAGSQVVAPIRFRAVGRGGAVVEARNTAHVWSVRDGKLARWKRSLVQIQSPRSRNRLLTGGSVFWESNFHRSGQLR